jgi:hypothetical protein
MFTVRHNEACPNPFLLTYVLLPSSRLHDLQMLLQNSHKDPKASQALIFAPEFFLNGAPFWDFFWCGIRGMAPW